MKKLIYLIALLLISTHLFASHGMGGEITWTCSGTSYIFKMKFYRDCNGIPGPTGPLTLSNNAGVNIQLNLTSQIDISPDGTNGTGNSNCVNCPPAGSGGNGAVEEFVFTSAPIVLPGTPPAGGWAFWWGDCCRSAALTNINNGGGWGFALRAKMYPYPNFIAGQCHDYSPYFAEKPSTIICTGYQFTYNHNAVDPELDSMVYSWDSPIDNIAYPWIPNIPYQPPYGVNNQLPGTPTLNTQSGELTYNPATGGYFATVIKVTAYKCGVIAAEIWREINVVLINGCSIPGIGPNNPPAVPLPISLPSNTPWTSNSDTVVAGDTVRFALTATDFDVAPPPVFGQTLVMNASGNEFGTGFTSQVAGCVLPPCATLTPPLPLGPASAVQTSFYWRTTCAHVRGLDTMCTRISNTYTFVIRSNDNFCPANGITVSTIRITVKRPPKLLPPKIKCASVLNKFGDVELSWAPPTPRDTHATFADYEIWASLNAAGPYTLVDSVYGGLNQYFTTSKLIANARQTALLGTHAQNSSIYFKMYTRCGCDSDSISIASNIVQTMKPIATPGAGGTVNVNWNAVHNPQIATSGNWYYIWKEYPIGTWTLIDSTTTNPAVLIYNDPSTVSICDDTITYRIATNDDSLHCTSWSAYAGIHLINNAPVSTITPNNPAFCNGQNVVLTANPGNATTYLWNTGATTQTITSSTAQTYTVTLTFMPGGCTSTTSTTTSVNPLPVPNITGTTSICQGATTTFDAGAGYSSYVWSTGIGGQTLNIGIAGTYTVTVTDVNGCTGSDNIILTVNPLPTPAITGVSTFCQGGSSTLNAGGPYTNYLWSTSATTQTINVNTAGNYIVTVTNGFGCTASTNQNVVVNALPVPVISGVTSFCTGNATTLDAGAGYSNYQWSNGATTQTVNVSTAGSFTVTVTNINGCTGSASKTTIVNPLPTPNVTGTTSICQGATTTFDAGAGYSSYVWSTGIGGQTLNIGIAGTYTVTVTDVNGCTGSDNINLTVNPLPTPAITGVSTFCQGGSSTLSAGGPYTNYLWSTTATTQTISVNTAGNYIVTVTNGFGCTASTNQNVVVNALPVPVISGVTSFCTGNATTLDAGAGYSNYQWSSGASTQTINVSTAGSFTVTVTNINGCTGSASKTTIVNPLPTPNVTGTTSICQGATTTFDAGAGYSSYVWSTGIGGQTLNIGIAGTYTVTVTDVNGCTGSDNIVLTVNPLPAPAITGVSTFCQGGSSTLNAGGPYTNYLWSTTATTQTISVNTAGNYIVTVTNGFGCTASTNQNVVVNALPVPVISGVTSFCTGNATTLDAGAGYSNYQWSTGATTQTVNVSTAGSFTVTVTNINGCTGSASKTTIVNPLPTPNVTGTTSICQGATTTFDAGAGYSSYVWSTGIGGQTLNTGIAGTYTVTVTDVNGCTGSDNINLTVNPLPVPAITGNNDFCQGNSSTLNAGAGFTNYLWSNAATTQTINVNASGNYIVTVTNGFNCTASTNLIVTVHALPNPVITGGTGICQGTFTILNAGNNYTNYSWSTGATTQTINVNTAGNFTVTVTDINGCTNTSSTTMVVNPLPTPAITGNNVVCQGVSTTFDAGTGYSSYVWSTGAGGQTINTGTSGTYTVTVTDVNGCTGSDNISLTVNPLPSPTITGNNVFCQGNSSVLNAGAGFNSYSWSTGSTAQTISVNTSGSYIVTVTNNFGCSASTNMYVTVNPLPNPVISGGTGICFGSSTTLDAGNGYSNYEWSIGATTQTIVVTNAGNYTVTVTDNNGCVNSTNTAMVVNPLPTPVITGNTAICQGTSTTFDAGAGYNSYVWSTGSGAQTLNATIAGLYTVTVTDANGCTNSDNINLVVNALPTPAITGNTVFCQGDNTTLNAGGGYTSYAWSNSSTTQTINTGNAGTYSVTVYDGNGCSASTSVNIVVNPLPNPVISGTSAICSGTTSTLNTGNYSSFLWSTGETTQSISTGDSGNYTVTVTDLNGCINSSPAFNLVVYQLPSAVISQNSAICIGGSSSFTISFTGTPPFHYMYNDGNQNSALLTSLTSTATINVTPNDTTTYTLVSVTDLHCLGFVSGSAVVTVNPLPTPAITGTNVICDGNSTVFSADGGYTNYMWSTAETTSSITLTVAGNYTVTVTDGNGCVSATSQGLTVNQTPVASFSNDTSLTCEIPNINFFNTSLFPAGSTFHWDFGDNSHSTAENPSHIFNTPGTYPISLIITTQDGCADTLTQDVDIMFYPLPQAEFKAEPTVASVFNSTVNFTDHSQNAVTWNWTFGDGGQINVQNPKHYYDDLGRFDVKLVVTNIAGCVSEYSEPILITPFYVPNAFTPNADGMNDVFFNGGYILDVASYNMVIFNRWGQKVFENDDYHKFWNGLDRNNKPSQEGAYVYAIKVVTKTGKPFEYQGTVSLIR